MCPILLFMAISYLFIDYYNSSHNNKAPKVQAFVLHKILAAVFFAVILKKMNNLVINVPAIQSNVSGSGPAWTIALPIKILLACVRIIYQETENRQNMSGFYESFSFLSVKHATFSFKKPTYEEKNEAIQNS